MHQRRTSSEDLRRLEALYSRMDSLSHEEGARWIANVSELLHRLAPDRAAAFDEITPYLNAGLSDEIVGPAWSRLGNEIRAAIAEAQVAEDDRTERSGVGPVKEPPAVKDPRVVFVVHGRNEAIRRGMFEFLRALDLDPLEWSVALHATGKASPYIGEVLDAAFSRAQAVVVLLTPDDEVRLSEALWTEGDPEFERFVQLQARPNVLFEAGMAFGSHAERTLLVQIGNVKPFSDVAGRHLVRLDNTVEKRLELADRLEAAGCAVKRRGRDWVSAGSFEIAGSGPPAAKFQESGRLPGSDRQSSPRLEISFGYLGSWREKQLIIRNVGVEVAHQIKVAADGSPIDKFPGFLAQKLPERLKAGEEFGIKLALSNSTPDRSTFEVFWTDEEGQKYTEDRMIQLI